MKAFLFVIPVIILLPVIYVFAAFCRSLIYTWKRPAGKLYEMRRAEGNFCEYNRLPHKIIDYVLAMEDNAFFSHKGYDANAIKRAFKKNLQQKKIVMGGSTITQQLAKNLYYRFDRRLFRKLSEFFTALHIEKHLDKTEILELYLNVIYYGHGIYGLYDAAHFYFNKDYQDLDVAQAFCLICILPSPAKINPLTDQRSYIIMREKKIKQVLWIGDEMHYVSLIREKIDCSHLLQSDNHNYSNHDIKINEKYNRKVFC